jgi:hypothetical protein
MKKAALATLFALLSVGSAFAGETGIINQAGPYEATMKFYLHPAHGFPGTPEPAEKVAAASTTDSVEAKPSAKLLANRSEPHVTVKARDTNEETGAPK